MRFPCLPPLFLVVLAFVPLLGYVSDFIRVFLFLNPACCIVVLLHNSRHIEEGINNLVAHDMREHARGFPTFLCPGNFIFLNKSYCLFFLLLVQWTLTICTNRRRTAHMISSRMLWQICKNEQAYAIRTGYAWKYFLFSLNKWKNPPSLLQSTDTTVWKTLHRNTPPPPPENTH